MTLPFEIPFSAILVVAIVVLAAFVWGVYELGTGFDQQRVLTSRSALDAADRRANSFMGRLDRSLRRTDVGRQIERRIFASGLRLRVATFVVLVLAGMVAVVVVIGYLLAPLLGIIAAVGVIAAAFSYLNSQEAKRREEFIGQLPEIARVLGNAAGAGLSIRSAIEMAADELGDPAKAELKRTADSLKIGQPFEEAMQDLADRLPSRELSVLVSTLVVSSRSGGSMVTALRNISGTLEDRKELRREVKTIMGHSVMTGWIIAFMGVASLFMINGMQPGVMDKMTGSFLGIIVLVVASAMFGIGLLLIRRFTRIET